MSIVERLSLRNEQAIRRSMRDVGHNKVAELIGLAPSTLADFKEHVPRIAAMLAASGLQVVPCTAKLYDAEYIRALETLAKRGISAGGLTEGEE